MKSFVAAVTATLLGIGVIASSQAQSGQLAFAGEVVSVTCDVSFNGVAGTHASIALPTVTARSLTHGASAGRTLVHLHVGGSDPICSSGAVSLSLNPTRAAQLVDGRLANQALAAPATNVVVGLRDAQDVPIDLATGWTSPVAAGSGSGADITFHAEYFAAGGDALAGVFQAPVQYTLIYP